MPTPYRPHSSNPHGPGVKNHPITGLPIYPAANGPLGQQLINVGEQASISAKGLRDTLDALENELAEAFEREDRKAATRARLNDLTRSQRRI